MEKTKLQAAVIKYSAIANDEDRQKQLNNDFGPADVKEINDAIAAAPPVISSGVGNTPPDEALETFKKIDYNKLEGEEVVKMCVALKGLNWNKKYDFAEYKIEVKTAERFEGVDGSPRDIFSIRLKDQKPVKVTNIRASDAAKLNGIDLVQSKKDQKKYFVQGAQFANSGRLYLPKK